MSNPAPVVECYSSGEYAERPRAFEWAGQRYRVTSVLSRWRLPDGPGFRVSTNTGAVFELIYREQEDRWDIMVIHDV